MCLQLPWFSTKFLHFIVPSYLRTNDTQLHKGEDPWLKKKIPLFIFGFIHISVLFPGFSQSSLQLGVATQFEDPDGGKH